MKEKTTRKYIKETYKNVISVNYCGLQSLLRYEQPRYYTTRIEGWGADIYVVDHETAISTGYAPFGNIKPSYETIQKYESIASQTQYDTKMSFEENRERHVELINAFVHEVV